MKGERDGGGGGRSLTGDQSITVMPLPTIATAKENSTALWI